MIELTIHTFDCSYDPKSQSLSLTKLIFGRFIDDDHGVPGLRGVVSLDPAEVVEILSTPEGFEQAVVLFAKKVKALREVHGLNSSKDFDRIFAGNVLSIMADAGVWEAPEFFEEETGPDVDFDDRPLIVDMRGVPIARVDIMPRGALYILLGMNLAASFITIAILRGLI